MMNYSIGISLTGETPPTEKAKEDDDKRNIIMSGKHQEMVPVLSNSLANSSMKAQSLYYNVCGMKLQTVSTYMEFGTYSSLDELRS